MNINTKKMLPIPQGQSVKGWQSISILENDEPLVDVTSFASNKIIATPKYYEQKILGSLSVCYVRESVGHRLTQAAYNLPDGWNLVIFDAWRPTEVQEFIYYTFLESVRREHLDWTEQQCLTYAQTYVSLASVDSIHPSPHLTGGAVDLSISDEKGVLLDMGTKFDVFTDTARTSYFEQNTPSLLTNTQKKQRNNRRLLYNLLIEQGFTNYPEEWWHFDYGNQFWGAIVNSLAKYSATKPNKT